MERERLGDARRCKGHKHARATYHECDHTEVVLKCLPLVESQTSMQLIHSKVSFYHGFWNLDGKTSGGSNNLFLAVPMPNGG